MPCNKEARTKTISAILAVAAILSGCIAVVLANPLAFSDNYATCLLDKMPGLQNIQAVRAAERICSSAYPEGIDRVPQGAGRGLLGDYNSSDECILQKSGGTQQVRAVALIRMACISLYDPDDSCRIQKPGPWCNYR